MSLRFVLIGSALLLAGCGTGTKPGEATAPAGVRQVTIHVEGAAKHLGIAWLAWPNELQEALEGLPGVESVKGEAEGDLFRVRYDPKQITLEALLDAIGMISKQELRGKLVPGDG